MSVFSKVKQIEISAEDSHEHDVLDRERKCLFLLDFFQESDTPFTLGFDTREWFVPEGLRKY